jgi:hypothetical protein
LAVGSSQLPWAHIKLAARLGPVKGRVGVGLGVGVGVGVGLGRDRAYSRDARRIFVPPIPKPDTVARSAAPPLVAGDASVPADSIGKPATVGKNAKLRAGSTGLVAPNACGQRPLRRASPRRPIRRARLWYRRARASAQRQVPIFLAATVRGAKSISRSPVAALASDFAALLAVRLCAE